jgi:hypothetical protein
VYIHVSPDGPGGDLPIQGAIKLRSIQQMLYFISNGIRVAPEFAVTPDQRTRSVSENPISTLQINVTDSEPATGIASVRYSGKYYSINDGHWDRAVFAQLNRLFQTAVGDVESAGLPITIAK